MLARRGTQRKRIADASSEVAAGARYVDPDESGEAVSVLAVSSDLGQDPAKMVDILSKIRNAMPSGYRDSVGLWVLDQSADDFQRAALDLINRWVQ